jgi:predicted nucleotidyltransferase
MRTGLEKLSPEAVEHLAAFKREVEDALLGLVARVTLFGSRARGEAKDDRDYDVAVFVREAADRLDILDSVSDAAYPHMFEGIFISPVVLPAAFLGRDPPTELAAEVARDGIALP